MYCSSANKWHDSLFFMLSSHFFDLNSIRDSVKIELNMAVLRKNSLWVGSLGNKLLSHKGSQLRETVSLFSQRVGNRASLTTKVKWISAIGSCNLARQLKTFSQNTVRCAVKFTYVPQSSGQGWRAGDGMIFTSLLCEMSGYLMNNESWQEGSNRAVLFQAGSR